MGEGAKAWTDLPELSACVEVHGLRVVDVIGRRRHCGPHHQQHDQVEPRLRVIDRAGWVEGGERLGTRVAITITIVSTSKARSVIQSHRRNGGGTIRHDTVRYGTIRRGTQWHGVVWHGSSQHGAKPLLTHNSTTNSVRTYRPAARHVARMPGVILPWRVIGSSSQPSPAELRHGARQANNS